MGKIQIKVLAVLQHEPAPLDAIEIAALVYGINPCSAAAYSAVRRALGKLSQKGLARAGSRHHPDRRRRWWASGSEATRAAILNKHGAQLPESSRGRRVRGRYRAEIDFAAPSGKSPAIADRNGAEDGERLIRRSVCA